MFFDDELPVSTKQPRATGSSATSRKNKSQRCSVCGGLGHKSRTCELAASKMGAGAHALSSLHGADDDDSKDPKTVLAAYGLLTLAESAIPLQPMIVKHDDRWERPATPPVSPWQLPSSPRILAS
eukprot:742453-Prymnesium_polylepis.1